jgi:hypothetical protein
LVGYVEGLLDQAAAGEVASHLETCAACRAESEEVRRLRERLLRAGEPRRQVSLDDAVMDRIVNHQASEIRRIAMRRFHKVIHSVLAAAAAVLVAALAVGLLMSTPHSSYALAQTLEANRGVRFVHIQADPPGEGLADAWAQFDNEGRPLHLRLEFPKTEDGAKVVVWQKGKAEVWFKDKKSAVVVYDSKVLAQISQAFLNSQQVMERLYARAEAGLAKIETMEPASKGEPVRLTVVWPDRPALREVYLVDRETKLLRTMETYGKVDGDAYRLLGRLQYLGYNEPIDPAFFTLDLPPDVMRVDQTTQEIGLAKGDMTDNQVAVAVVRQFFEAIGAKDYAKAGRLYEGIPAEKVKQIVGQADRVQIVSLGEPTPHARPETQFLSVPFEVELETGGTKSIKKGTAYVRPVYNHPDHWTINGGI